MNQDAEHLNLLSIFHYVLAGITGLCACFPVFHLAMGIMFLTQPEFLEPEQDVPPEMPMVFGLLFTIIPALIICLGWTLAICIAYAGRCLARRKRYTFCLVVAAVSCLFMPFGTILGVFTIIVLVRPSVKTLFEESAGDPFGG